MARTKQIAKNNLPGKSSKLVYSTKYAGGKGKSTKSLKRIARAKHAKQIKTDDGIVIKKPHRFRPGTVALREIRKFQKSTELLMQKAPFQRLMREVMHDLKHQGQDEFRVTKIAFLVLQEISEKYLTNLFEMAQDFAEHGHRVGIQLADLHLAVKTDNAYHKLH